MPANMHIMPTSGALKANRFTFSLYSVNHDQQVVQVLGQRLVSHGQLSDLSLSFKTRFHIAPFPNWQGKQTQLEYL